MAHTEHKLEILGGLVKFKTNEQKIWGVLILLALLTAIEVVLGIIRPDFMETTKLFSMKLINWVFVILTIVKAYYITWDFMHMRDEKMALKLAVVGTLVIYIPYILFIFLTEGNYVHDVLQNSFVTWKF